MIIWKTSGILRALCIIIGALNEEPGVLCRERKQEVDLEGGSPRGGPEWHP